MGVGGGVQFLGQKGGKEWRLRRSGGRKVVELCPRGQSHIHRARAFRGRGLFGVVRMRLVLEQ